MKKFFLTIKKKTILIFLVGMLTVLSIFLFPSVISFSSSPKPEYTIVIDAGHGGIDGGAVGELGISESKLNLDYALELKKLCESVGIKVTMTRRDMNGLYSPLASNKKRSEMQKREKIIKESKADAVISIHMNSFALASSKGAQVFFKQGDESGKAFAEEVQKELINNIENSRKEALPGDYYVLNCSPMPAILIECGYLSNLEEEKLLCNKEYKTKFCGVIFQGILNYFNI